jgi:hypothetical protein
VQGFAFASANDGPAHSSASGPSSPGRKRVPAAQPANKVISQNSTNTDQYSVKGNHSRLPVGSAALTSRRRSILAGSPSVLHAVPSSWRAKACFLFQPETCLLIISCVEITEFMSTPVQGPAFVFGGSTAKDGTGAASSDARHGSGGSVFAPKDETVKAAATRQRWTHHIVAC